MYETIQDRFNAFHASNPIVYKELVRLATDMKNKGHNKIGIRMLWEVMRWNILMKVVTISDDYKLNDHFTSRYVRLITANEPLLKDVFELRELRAQ